jgi:dienelactone hydrolase
VEAESGAQPGAQRPCDVGEKILVTGVPVERQTAPTPTPGLDAAIVSCRAVIDLAQAGRFEQIRAMFAPQLRALIPVETLQTSWQNALAGCGAVLSAGTPASEPAGPGAGAIVVKILLTCEHGQRTLMASVDAAGWLGGLQLAPASAAEPQQPWKPPTYVDHASFDEHDVTVGSGPLAVPGTLTLPHHPGPRPAVVLLGGSGPVDRDETIGRNKPLKDVAWGLASAGIVVLRFDKVTHVHPAEVMKAGDITVADEYVTDAIAAARLLRQHAAVDAGQVYVLGHSLGGTVAPRVAAAEPAVAGLIIFAGGAQPLHWAIVRQIRYLTALDPDTAAGAQPAIDAVSEQARLIDSPDLSPATPTSLLPFGTPASYWLDLRDYRPAALAATLGKPMLILQGGRDYQVTVADDLARWKTSLAHCPDITVRIYEDDNHLFFPGTGPSTPAEYEPAQHVDPQVVADIAAWLTTRRRAATL